MVTDTQRIKLHTAAQLLIHGYPESSVVGGFTDEEVQQARIMAEELRQQHSNGHSKSAAAELATTGWLKRRIMLRITNIPSKKLAAYAQQKAGKHNVWSQE